MLNTRDSDVSRRARTLAVYLRPALWLLPLSFLGVFYFYPLGAVLTYSLADVERTVGALESLRDSYIFHKFRGGIPQVEGNRISSVFLHKFKCRIYS